MNSHRNLRHKPKMLFKATLGRTVNKQAYLNGKSLFKEEAIGVEIITTSYSETERVFHENYCKWSKSRDYSYRIINTEVVHEVAVPVFTFIHSQDGLGYRLEHK